MDKTTAIQTTEKDPFVVGETDMSDFKGNLVKLRCGVLMLCTSGNGRMLIDLKEYDVRENTTMVILPSFIISVLEADENFRVSFFSFSEEIFREISFKFEHTFFHYLKENPLRYIEDKRHTRPARILLRFGAGVYADKENLFRIAIVRSLLQCCFLELYDKIQRFIILSPDKKTGRKEELFKQFMVLLRENSPLQRDVNFYAQQMHITSRYLSGIVQELTGKSAKEIIDEFTILEIKSLFQSTDLSALEIAYRLGFPDGSYFGRYFKRHTGMSPVQYKVGCMKK